MMMLANFPPENAYVPVSVTSSCWRASVIDAMTPLSQDFAPGPFDVICSRGKKAKSHSGNLQYQSLIAQSAEKYAKAEGKLGKSLIVSEIIDRVRQTSPNGGFVKLEDGRWFEIGDVAARERIGQSLRDLLSGQYRSSATAKKRRREENNARMIDNIDTLIDSNQYVSQTMQQLSNSIGTKRSKVSDFSLITMMTKANSDILAQLKKEATVQSSLCTSC